MRFMEVEAAITALTAAKTILYIPVPATACIGICEVEVGTYNNATNFQMRIALTRVTNPAAAAGTAATATPTETGSAASDLTGILSDLSAEPTTYATQHLWHKPATSIGGYKWRENDPNRFLWVAPVDEVGVRTLETVTSSNFVVRVKFVEISLA